MSSTTQRKAHIKPLTSLRFFFALMVYCCHINYLQDSEITWVKELYLSTLVEGFLGVSFFFILSGFIIAYNYLEKFELGNIVRKDFYKARAARLYPLTLICLFLALPEYLFYHKTDSLSQLGIAFMANITLLQSYIPFKDIYMSFNYPDWSISTEMFFYVCFPFIVNALSKSKRKIRALLVLTLILLVTILVAIPQTSKALQHAVFYINPFVRVTDFCIGILVFLIYNKYRNISWPDYIFTLLETLSLMVFGVFFIYHSSVNITYRYSVYYWLPMILIIFIFAYQKGYYSRLLSHPTLLLLGEASFGFYLIHQIAIRYFVFFNKRYFHIENEILMIVITFSAALLFSILSYKFVEPKLNIWVKNKLEYKK